MFSSVTIEIMKYHSEMKDNLFENFNHKVLLQTVSRCDQFYKTSYLIIYVHLAINPSQILSIFTY